MNLDELRTVQSKERRKDSLQQLRDSFYRDVASFIQDLKATRDRRAQQVDDPFGDSEVRRLSDELETAEEVAEAVYERRVGKVVKLASFAAAEMPVDDEGMTSEERELFDDLVRRISQNKQAVLDVLSGPTETTESRAPDSSKTGPTNPAETPSKTQPTQPTATQTTHKADSPLDSDNVLAEAMGTDTKEPTATTDAESAADPASVAAGSGDTAAEDVPPPEAEPEPDAVLGTSTDGGTAKVADLTHSGTTHVESSTPTAGETTTSETADNTSPTDEKNERTTVRITKNVGDIFCVDGREYTLRSEDVVTLPTTNAEPLVDQDAAQRLE